MWDLSSPTRDRTCVPCFGRQILYFILFFYFWLHWVFIAARGLFSSCSKRGLLFIVVRGLLIAVASVVEEHGL